MNQITTRYITEGDACYEQYVISDPAAKTELVITPERGGMITVQRKEIGRAHV